MGKQLSVEQCFFFCVFVDLYKKSDIGENNRIDNLIELIKNKDKKLTKKYQKIKKK